MIRSSFCSISNLNIYIFFNYILIYIWMAKNIVRYNEVGLLYLEQKVKQETCMKSSVLMLQ